MTPPEVAHFDAAAVDVTCQMCAHPWKSHDATAIRFCTATMTRSAFSPMCLPVRERPKKGAPTDAAVIRDSHRAGGSFDARARGRDRTQR